MDKTIKCPGCGASLIQYQEDSLSITCNACGKLINLSTNQCTEVVGEKFPESHLEIGKIGELFQKKWQIIGRTLYEGSISERDDEDGQFYAESWSYVSWSLISTEGDIAYITEDSEGFTFSESVQLKPYKKISERELAFDGHSCAINETGDMKLMALQGEFSWVPSLFERIEYIEFWGNGKQRSVETRKLPNSDEVKEIECFTNESISRETVLSAFGMKHILDEEEERAQEVSQWSNFYFIAAAVLLVFSLLSFGLGSEAFRTSFAASEVPTEGKIVGPFTLSSVNRVHEINVNVTGIPKNTWSGVGVTLLDSDQLPLSADDLDFWHETGSDDEGYWEESDENFSKIFRLSEAGEYFAEVEVDPTSTATGAVIQIAVSQRVVATRYLLFGTFLLFALGCSLRYYKSANPFFILLGIIMLIYFIIRNAKAAEDD